MVEATTRLHHSCERAQVPTVQKAGCPLKAFLDWCGEDKVSFSHRPSDPGLWDRRKSIYRLLYPGPVRRSSNFTNYRKPAAGIAYQQEITHQCHNVCFIRGISASKATFAYLQEIKRPNKVKCKIHPITRNKG